LFCADVGQYAKRRQMTILDLTTYDRALDHVDKLIVRPLETHGHHQFDEYDKKQLTDIIQNTVDNPDKFTQQLASDFGHYTKNWNIDWDWISHHILWDFYNFRQAKSILDMFGSDRTVIKQLDKTDSPESCQLYLTDPNNINSEPKAFKLKDLITNGSNLGKTKEDWKPVIGMTDFGYYEYHPYGDPNNEKETGHYIDSSSLSTKPDGQIWNENEREYKFEDKPLTERQKKIRSLIKITVTTDDGETMNYDDWKKREK